MSELQAGYLLHGRYRIIRVLGKGGMGMVYLADDLTLNKQAAVKVNFAAGEESAGQFLQEAHLLAALHHPNLPRVTDYFIEDPGQYLVMDFLPGLDLQSWLERDGRQPWSVMRPLIAQLCDALHYLHIQNPPVTHRDIKPGNIKLRADGTAVLVDFGIAKAAEASQMTSVGARGYTPGFAPPEQAGGSRTGPYSDQYALAATLYNLLTGVKPVDSIKRVLDNEIVPDACVLNPEIPIHVSRVLARALSIQPEDRFNSVREFMSALDDPRYSFDKPSKPVKKKSIRRGLTAVLLIASVITVLGGVTLFLLAGNTAQTPPVSTPVRTAIAENPEQPTAAPLTPTAVTPTAAPTKETRSLLAGGKWLAYSSNQEDKKTFQIWLMQAGLNRDGKPESTSSRQLTKGTGDKTQPAWSPDGKFLLYTAPAVNGSLANGLDIWRISVTGGDPVDLTNFEGDESFSSWSPDGKVICFTGTGGKTGETHLYFMDPDGRNIRQIKSGYFESQGTWSPENSALLHVITTGNASYFARRSSENKYAVTTPFDPNQSNGRLGQVTDPAFSPDGSRVAYTRTKNHDRWIGIVEYASKGANFSLITKTGKDHDPAWSADGRWIAFTSERDGLPQVYIMTSAGLLQTGVSELTASSQYPAWQP
jgi:serine/threonine-protein kinase